MLKKGLIVLLLILVLSVSSYSEETKKSAVGGYLLSGLVGFGTGHFYIGSDHAMKFLLLEGGSLAVYVVGTVIATSAVTQAYNFNDPAGAEKAASQAVLGGTISLVGGVALLAFHIWDFIDIFGEIDKKKAEGVVAWQPSVNFGPNGQTTVALSYNY